MSDTRTMTLADFLLARIEDDEWCANHMRTEARDWDGDAMNPEGEAIGYEWVAFALRGDRWEKVARLPKHATPARVLAECEAKRRIVALHVDMEAIIFAGGPSADWWAGWRAGMEPTLRALAMPYADHADYRDEWKP